VAAAEGHRQSPGDGLVLAARTAGLLAVTSAIGLVLTSDTVSGSLAIPLTSLDEMRRWLDDSSPALLPAAVLRLVALAVCAYLALTLVLTLVAQAVDRHTGGRAVRAVRRLLPAALQGLLTGGAQCSLVAAAAFPLAGLPTAVQGDPPTTTATTTATMTKLGPELPADPVPATPATSTTPAVSTATMTRLPTAPPTTAAEPAGTTTVPPTPLPAADPIAPTTAPTSLAPVPPPPRAPAPANPDDEPGLFDDTWTVGPGDTFWSIAEEALTDRRGSFPTQDQTVRYWQQLIDANRSQLAAPDNPDLLLPGQSLLLPPPN
jgi:hypothetical protein